MAVKWFCDLCGNEIHADELKQRKWDHLTRNIDQVSVSMHVMLDGVMGAGVVCRACIFKVVNEGRDHSGIYKSQTLKDLEAAQEALRECATYFLGRGEDQRFQHAEDCATENHDPECTCPRGMIIACLGSDR